MKKIISLILAILLVFSVCPITALAEETTSESSDWEYEIVYEHFGKTYVEITKYNGTDDTVTVPNKIDEKTVIGIGGEIKAKDITISEGIKYIGKKAFVKAENLSLSLPSSLEYISFGAFANASISKINFPEGLIGIDESAFKGVFFADTDIVLPESLKFLNPIAFAYANITSLYVGKNATLTEFEYNSVSGFSDYDIGGYSTRKLSRYQVEHYNPDYFIFIGNPDEPLSINVSEENPYISSKDDIIYSKDFKELMFAPCKEKIIIPESVDLIWEYAFAHKNYNEVTVSSSVEEIKPYGFSYAHIDNLVFKDNSRLRKIEENAFHGAVIDNITIPKSIVKIERNAFFTASIPILKFEEGSYLVSAEDNAFYNSNIEEIDFSNCTRLSDLGYWNAFKGNNTLKKINLENTLIRKIGFYWFKNCSALEEVILSEYTYEIGAGAFENCTSLEKIENADGVNTKYTDSFKNAAIDFSYSEKSKYVGYGVYNNIRYFEYGEYIIIDRIMEDVENLVIPSYINSKPVTEISTVAFQHKAFNSVTLPETLECISEAAFQGCEIKEKIKLPSSLKFLEDAAFGGVEIDDFELNEGLLYVGNSALPCGKTDVFIIPDSVLFFHAIQNDELLENGFVIGANYINPTDLTGELAVKYIKYSDEYCHYPQRIMVSKNNPLYSDIDGVLYNKDKTELISYPQSKQESEFVVPESVLRIADNAFAGNINLEKVTISKKVNNIGFDVFLGCKKLSTIVFADGVSIDTLNETFYGAKSIKNVLFGKNVNIRRLIASFSNTSIEEIELPNSIKVMGDAFRETPLKSIKLNEGLDAIGHECFYKTDIEKIVLPKSVNSIMSNAFAYCDKLSYINVGNTKRIASGAFFGCSSLEAIDLTGVYSVSSNAFKDCDNLKKFYFTKEEKEAYIAENEFQGNEILETVVIGNSVTEIKEKAFADCKNLETALIASGVETIDDTAFDNCEKLTILCEVNSPAMLYAKKNDISYQTFVVAPIPDQEYTGKALKPSLKVSQGGNALTVNKDYKATYANNINIGKAKVSVLGLGDYSIFGTTVNFNIVHHHKYTVKTVKPTYEKGGYTLHTCICKKSYKTDKKDKLKVNVTSIKKLTNGKKSITVSFKKVKNVSGYQIQYSTDKSYKNKKTVSLSNPKTAKKTIKNLKSKKKYYVRIRAYKKVSKKTYYSSWSKSKSIKTK